MIVDTKRKLKTFKVQIKEEPRNKKAKRQSVIDEKSRENGITKANKKGVS